MNEVEITRHCNSIMNIINR